MTPRNGQNKPIIKTINTMKKNIRRTTDEGISKINDILKKIRRRSEEGKKEFNNLYSLLENPSFAKWATGKLLTNKGNNTPGVDTQEVNGLYIERIESISKKLKDGEYEAQPARRVLIPKPGKTEQRLLGIPSVQDKVVQQMIYEILEAIYEPIFRYEHGDRNYGFRKGYSITEAMRKIKQKAQNTRWCIKGDIKGAYDNVKHGILINILEEKIKDKRLVKLIKHILESGIMKENEKKENSFIGTPQGSVISPILFNIYMTKLDEKVIEIEKEREFENKKEERKSIKYKESEKKSSQMSKITAWIRIKDTKYKTDDFHQWSKKDKEEGMKRMKELKRIGQEIKKISSLNIERLPRRMVYIRYADEWVIFLNGEKEQAKEIKEDIKDMLEKKLGLKLNEEKTKITDLKKDETHFLGFSMLLSKKTNPLKKGTLGRIKRTTNHQLRIGVDESRLRKRFTLNGFLHGGDNNDKVISKASWTTKSDYEIIQNFNWLIRGLITYWSQGVDFYYVTRRYVGWLRHSAKLTLAHKRRLSIRKVEKKYEKKITVIKQDAKEIKLIDFEEAKKMFYRLKEKSAKEVKK